MSRYLPSGVAMGWDPQQYGRFADERSRPFFDLVERVGAVAPRRVVDLGCGSGALTARLAERWPTAQIEGVDSSPQMIAVAPTAERVAYRVGDMTTWTPPDDLDVAVSNAALHWVPTHRELIRQWAGALRDGGWLAFQVPGNFASPSHTSLRRLAESPRWAAALNGVLRHDVVGTPQEYAEVLLGAGLTADVWETTYVQVLSGDDAVLQWLRGTALRPVMAALHDDDYQEFEAELALQLRRAYPPTAAGTLFPFRRIFAVGCRR